ncbi:hypothetical protein C7212DRAFT_360039 [Tuber magnatum]|uniref:Uncharacterized protein n=1 Tax=Tuber magnatum TaxID=42249 RepID=A0A317SGY6_9PEZI|nr:hypothetical protein C7212DRAFT_360039 [Tuber magnatum]
MKNKGTKVPGTINLSLLAYYGGRQSIPGIARLFSLVQKTLQNMSTPILTNTPARCQPPILTTLHTLNLSSEEAAICKLFVDTAQEVDKDKPENDPLYISTNIEKYSPKPDSMSKIESNPKKSKYLETASMKILGLDIDFVNLRSKLYSRDSWIPHMVCSTLPSTVSRGDVDLMAPGIQNPKQDALHRNCTSTPSFTICTELVEGFTGLGLQDLATHLICTPLPPKETSADDPPPPPPPNPLCLMHRLYHSRLSLTPTNHLPPVLQPALETKISRERIGIGIIKMIKGCSPHAPLSLIQEVDHYNEIFAPPIQDLPLLPVQDMKIAADIIRRQLFGSTSSHPRISKLLTTTSKKCPAWLIVATSPQKNQRLSLANKKNTPAAATAIKEGLRYPNSRVIQNMVINLEHWGRGKMGLEMRTLGTNWKNQVSACSMFELMDLKNSSDDEVEERGVIDGCETFLKTIAEKVLGGHFNLKSNDLAVECALTPGAWVKPTIEESLQHQLDNPH